MPITSGYKEVIRKRY